MKFHKERSDQLYKTTIAAVGVLRHEILRGPRGGTWEIDYLADGTIGLKGPWNRIPVPTVPQWVRKYIPAGQALRNCGGTTYRQRRYVTERLSQDN